MDPSRLAAALEPCRHSRRWWIAYSGGVDSHVLLHSVAALVREGDYPPLAALHINHRINPRAADWAAHCRAVCDALGVELRVIEVDVARASGEGLEAAARTARYAAFERQLADGEVLLQGHHRDDQIETLLLRLLRGSGLAGLSAMPAARELGAGRLFRPFLNMPRSELMAYAQGHRLRWIHDDSNDDERFDRNFLRHRVAPLLEPRWPAYRQTLARAAEQAGEAGALLRELAAADLAAARRGAALDLSAYGALSPARQRNLLRHWLESQRLPLPSREQLEQVRTQCGAAIDADICVSWPGVEVRRFRGALHAMAPLASPAETDLAWQPLHPFGQPGLGQLRARPAIGQGLRADREYRVRNRRGGERCKPVGRAHSQALKKLLQERDVPPWRRDRLPLVYCGEELAAVGDLWICEGYQASGEQRGWLLEWSFPAQ